MVRVMNHHFMIERLAKDHLAALHADAARARLMRERGGRKFRRLWRRTRGAPAHLVVIDNPHSVSSTIRSDTSRVA